jgi:hypothetical protein
MEWNGRKEWNGMEWNGMEWNGMEMEWNGMEWNGMEWKWNGTAVAGGGHCAVVVGSSSLYAPFHQAVIFYHSNALQSRSTNQSPPTRPPQQNVVAAASLHPKVPRSVFIWNASKHQISPLALIRRR